ncbi:thiol peroxidase [Fusibacter sp. A1]|nr:thiol peroxidase [Fusibacter sp. A1]RXV62603.1 thiol peroxidase [Fusibacter sp. A1]
MNITFGGNTVTVKQAAAVGQKAPNFTATAQDLSPFDFYSKTDNKVKVISVAPSIDTGVCSLQTQRFNEEAGKLKEDVQIVTITVDLPFAQKRFCAAEGVENIDVVSDYQNRDFGSKYGFMIEEFKLLSRGVVVVDRDNTIKYVEYVNEVTNHPDYDKALEAIQALI